MLCLGNNLTFGAGGKNEKGMIDQNSLYLSGRNVADELISILQENT